MDGILLAASQRRAPEKIEFVGGIFSGDRERLKVLAMILETLGIDQALQLGKLEDWRAALAGKEVGTAP